MWFFLLSGMSLRLAREAASMARHTVPGRFTKGLLGTPPKELQNSKRELEQISETLACA
jgi:hypothetical protein